MSGPEEELMGEYDKLMMNARSDADSSFDPRSAAMHTNDPLSVPLSTPVGQHQHPDLNIQTRGPGFDATSNVRQPTASGMRLGSMIEESGPPIVDRDVERLSEQLDQMSNMFKREVMGSFLDTKNLLLAKQTEILDAERRQNAALLSKKQDEIEMYKEKLACALHECERQLVIIEQMGEYLAMKGEQKDGGMEMARCFSYWKEELGSARHEKMIQRWPEPHYNKALRRRYLGEWRDETRIGRRVAVDKFWQGKMESMSTSIVAEYETQLAAMQAELGQAKRQLQEERASRSQLYDDLMSQFRRGVCAFNLEALAALKPGEAEQQQSQPKLSGPLQSRDRNMSGSGPAAGMPQKRTGPSQPRRATGMKPGVRQASRGMMPGERSVRNMTQQQHDLA